MWGWAVRHGARVLVGIGSALVSTSCASRHAPTAPPPPVVSVAPVVQRDVPVHNDYVGTLDAYVNADARARVRGILLEQHFTEGSMVKAGQLLFVIDPKPYEAAKLQAQGDLAQAKAQLAKAEADVARDTPLVAKQAVSRQDLDHAIADRESATGQVAAAQGRLDTAVLNLGYTRVTSPIEGIAGITQVRIGNLVGQGEPTLLTTVSEVNPMRVVMPLAERDYLHLAQKIAEFERVEAQGGQHLDVPPIQLILADGSIFPQAGRFAIVGSRVDPATGTLTVQALFPNPEEFLRPGQYARVRINDELKQVVIVPQRSVTQTQGKDQVAIVGEGDKIEMRRVKLGPTSGAFVVIQEGLKPDERVVVDGIGKVQAGQAVSPQPADTSTFKLESVPREPQPGDGGRPSSPRGVTAPQPSATPPAK